MRSQILVVVVGGLAVVGIVSLVTIMYGWLLSPPRPLSARITDTSDTAFEIIPAATEGVRTVRASGTVHGIVSDNEATVFLLVRHFSENTDPIDTTFWRVLGAKVDALGNWEASYRDYFTQVLRPSVTCLGRYSCSDGARATILASSQELPRFPPVDFWELFAIATKKPNEVESFIVPQVGGISMEDAQGLQSVECTPSIIRVRSEGVYVDRSSVPAPQKYC